MARLGCFFSALFLGKKKRSKNPSLPRPDPMSADIPAEPGDPGAYEGCDEHDKTLSMKRDHSDLDLQTLDEIADPVSWKIQEPDRPKQDDGVTPTPDFPPDDCGYVSDPGAGPTGASLWGPPVLKRSCSNIETKRSIKARALDLSEKEIGKSSPLSARSDCSADKVMLKKRSSSQVLPSRSRKIWWRLFLWSHRSLHGSVPPATVASANQNRQAGYSSDTLESAPDRDKRKQKGAMEWVAFSAESSSSLGRVGAWVDSLEEGQFWPLEEEEKVGDEFSGSTEMGESSGKNYNPGPRTPDEVVQANSLIQSLNSFSSVAHISGMGLKIIPNISAFTSLRSVNLSGNYIVQINSGSLPKSLHALDLSRNKIVAVDGLRELTRLRVLNLSYNRISRIGHGLSSCTLIKELYLAGNKISDVDGLHRLLKLTVLDLSFNKIATAKALGQLVANYNSLLALNLIGNPVQTNTGDDHLRKAVSSLLPHLTYLNKQLIKPQRTREVTTDSIAKAALSGGSSGTRRRMTRRSGQAAGLGSSLSGHYQSSKHKHKRRHQHSITTSRK